MSNQGVNNPYKLFTFGARVQAFQRRQLVFTLWKFNKQLWCAYLDTNGEERNVDVNPGPPDDVWNEDNCVLVC